MIQEELVEIYSMGNHGLKFYIDSNGLIFWRKQEAKLMSLVELPKKIQAIFLLACIHNHELARRTKIISNPIAWIDLYIKGKYMNNESLEL